MFLRMCRVNDNAISGIYGYYVFSASNVQKTHDVSFRQFKKRKILIHVPVEVINDIQV